MLGGDATGTLSEAGMDWATPVMDGQELHLTGTAPSEEAKAAAESLFDEKVGFMGPYTDIINELVVEAPAPEPTIDPRYYDIEMVKTGGEPDADGNAVPSKLVLSGEVPDQDIRSAMIASAESKFDEVDHSGLTVGTTGEPVIKGFQTTADRGFDALKTMVKGTGWIKSGELGVRGEVHTTDLDAVNALGTGLPEKYTGKTPFSLIVIEAADNCDAALAEVLKRHIQFKTSKATISAKSKKVLKDLKDVVDTCPPGLQLAIEGHTDDRGDDASNMTLSQERAQAVQDALVAMGVSAENLKPQGFGETKPMADNTTAAGRSENRRIEMHIVRN